ncbi:MAG TPA: bifunctional nicotinamidase/pyrazinamidase [Deltaproteobacteria bacterium]|nr:bifunctional nicotinamidase/pyrazinamidase [Deltaproteobacteria bacterium]
MPDPTRALIVIDVQRDFCPGGALEVPHGDEVVPVCNRLMAEFQHVVLTQDWHPEGHASFASSHPGRAPYETIELPYGSQVLWPDHCVVGSPGAEFHPELEIARATRIVQKGTHPEIDSYSAFFDNDQTTSTGLAEALRGLGVEHVVLAGLATDFCVLYTAMDARSAGFAVTVIEDGVRGIDLEGSVAAAWNEMMEAGVQRS